MVFWRASQRGRDRWLAQELEPRPGMCCLFTIAALSAFKDASLQRITWCWDHRESVCDWASGKCLYKLLRFWQAEVSARVRSLLIETYCHLPIWISASSLSSSCPSFFFYFSLVLLLRESVFNFISRPLRVANRQTALSLEKINASKKRSQILT